MRIPPRPEAVGEPLEVGFIDGTQEFGDRTLDDLVLQRRHTPVELHSDPTNLERDKAAAHLTLRWKGGTLGEIDLALPRSRPATIRTAEGTVALVRRLAVHYPDTVIAGILNTQGRTLARCADGIAMDWNRALVVLLGTRTMNRHRRICV